MGTAATLGAEEAERFLFAEARLLDERRFDEWEALFTDDGVYLVPIDPAKEPSRSISIIYDDRRRLGERVFRQMKTPVLDQNPPSRTIRFVSNVEVAPDAADGIATVRCHQLIAEMRPGGPGQAGLNAPRWFAARCEYRLRRTDGGLKIAAKKVVFLNSDLPHYNLSFIP
ncbi:MAG: aromatic-ring-hydroxylating dioxygenase subunit beta [Armatimonadetes bacterium]|nr:aromatic-ring-hydroxylating dioxygenase subunit beta [Armatimonadota bacterium]